MRPRQLPIWYTFHGGPWNGRIARVPEPAPLVFYVPLVSPLRAVAEDVPSVPHLTIAEYALIPDPVPGRDAAYHFIEIRR